MAIYDFVMPSAPGRVVGQMVRLHRQNRGWTQDVFARRLRLAGLRWSQAQVAFFEGGRRVDLTLSEVILIAKALGVRLEELLGGPDSLALGTAGDLAQDAGVEIPLDEAREILGGKKPRPLIPRKGPALRNLPGPYSPVEEGFARQLGLLPGEVKALAEDLWGRSIEEEEAERVRSDHPRQTRMWLLNELNNELSRRSGEPTLEFGE